MLPFNLPLRVRRSILYTYSIFLYNCDAQQFHVTTSNRVGTRQQIPALSKLESLKTTVFFSWVLMSLSSCLHVLFLTSWSLSYDKENVRLKKAWQRPTGCWWWWGERSHTKLNCRLAGLLGSRETCVSWHPLWLMEPWWSPGVPLKPCFSRHRRHFLWISYLTYRVEVGIKQSMTEWLIDYIFQYYTI